VIVDITKVRRFKRIVKARSEDAAIQLAVERALEGAAAIRALDRLRRQAAINGETASSLTSRRGTTKAPQFVRTKVTLAESKARRLQQLLRARSESAAIRSAVDRALAGERALRALERLQKSSTWGKRLAL
jgi:hypothetical protein